MYSLTHSLTHPLLYPPTHPPTPSLFIHQHADYAYVMQASMMRAHVKKTRTLRCPSIIWSKLCPMSTELLCSGIDIRFRTITNTLQPKFTTKHRNWHIHQMTHSFTHLLTRSLARSLTDTLTHSRTHALLQALTHSLTQLINQ